jgi:C-terminal processing protease CtpA/Prc
LNIWGEDIDIYTKKIQSRLCEILAQDVAGCIIDLRLNGGGNMYPMLAGLYPLLGNNTVLHTTHPDSSLQYSWLLKKGNLYARNASGEEVAVTHIDASCKAKWDKLKVMVLVGPATMSSGQATAVAFLNRPYTLLVGEPTAEGYVTAKNYYTVADGITLNMSAGFIRARDGEIFTRTLNPQLWVLGGDNFQNPSADLKVIMSGIQIKKTDW